MSELGHRQTIKLFAGAVGPVRAAFFRDLRPTAVLVQEA